jgi:hypothetical protein
MNLDESKLGERFQVTALRKNSGERVQGYIYQSNIQGAWFISTPVYEDEQGYHERQLFAIDPATVEPVALKPIAVEIDGYGLKPAYDHKCPVCGKDPYLENYCWNCGQRIDWEESE